MTPDPTLAAQIEAQICSFVPHEPDARGKFWVQRRGKRIEAFDEFEDAYAAGRRLDAEAILNLPAIVTALRQAEGNVPNLNSYIDGYEDAQEVSALRQAEAAPGVVEAIENRPRLLGMDFVNSIEEPIRVSDERGNPHLHYSAAHVRDAFAAGMAKALTLVSRS